MTTDEFIDLLQDGGVMNSEIELDTGVEIIGVKVRLGEDEAPITVILTDLPVDSAKKEPEKVPFEETPDNVPEPALEENPKDESSEGEAPKEADTTPETPEGVEAKAEAVLEDKTDQ